MTLPLSSGPYSLPATSPPSFCLQPGSSAALGQSSVLFGSVVAYGLIAVGYNVTVTGTMVALNAAVNLNTNTVEAITNACP